MGFEVLADLPEFGFQGAFWIVIISFLVFVAFVLYWVAGRVQEHVEFEGRRICKMRITLDGRGVVEGNLAHNDAFDEETLEAFEQKGETKVIKGILDQLKADGRLHIYNYKITDDTNIDEDFADKTRIISPVPLQSTEISYEDEIIRRPILKFWKAEGYRNCTFLQYPLTRKVRLWDEDEQEWVDFWLATPLDHPKGKKYTTLRDNPFPDAPVHVFSVQVIKNAEALAKFALIAKKFQKALEANQSLEAERDTYKELHEEMRRKFEDKHLDYEDSQDDLAQKDYYVGGKEAYKKQQTLGAFWIILASVASGFMSLMMTAMFPEADLELKIIAGMIVGLLITGGGFMFYMSTVKPVQKMRINDLDE